MFMVSIQAPMLIVNIMVTLSGPLEWLNGVLLAVQTMVNNGCCFFKCLLF